jgi:hypothetical protein
MHNSTMPGSFVEMLVLLTFCPSWPQTIILPISTSGAAGILGMSHHARPSLKAFAGFLLLSKWSLKAES